MKNWFTSIRGFTKINDNLTIFSPIIIPLPYSKIANSINSFFFNRILKKWVDRNNFNNITYISFLATPLLNQFIDSTNYQLKIYYPSDNHEIASLNKNFLIHENAMASTSDAVFATSQKLLEKFKYTNKNLHKIPAGVELDKFNLLKDDIVPDDLKKISKPIIGFVGGINFKIDIDILLDCASKLNNYSFVMIGNADSDLKEKLSLKKNIFFLGQIKHTDLYQYIQNFHCGIIPYKVNEFTNSVYPSKLNEFFAMGKPVVSTNLYEIDLFNKDNNHIVDIAKDSNDFSSLIKSNVEANDLKKLEQRKLIAKKNSWEERYFQITKIIEKLKEEKKIISIDWERNFLVEMQKIKKRIFKYSIIIATILFVMFISPIPYYVGKNLTINDTATNSDVIVGLSGYGQAVYINNSYQQRALDVYHYYSKGLSNKIILSGRKQLIEEFTLMKAILLSLGVPEKDIYILKKPSNSSYQNLVNLNEKMEQNNFNSANIITAPYHQLRVKMILNKISKNKKFNIINISNNERNKKWFFNYSKIKVIAYEYSSIIYNMLKF
jgi:glycosyltransferase involved in cell wall biosynthesis/uncharacterized SAM-binding protein YcdF (DUF218 family)